MCVSCTRHASATGLSNPDANEVSATFTFATSLEPGVVVAEAVVEVPDDALVADVGVGLSVLADPLLHAARPTTVSTRAPSATRDRCTGAD
jgi:hypothetical protein